MPSLDEIAGLLDAKSAPSAGSDDADDTLGNENVSDDHEHVDAQDDDNPEAGAEEGESEGTDETAEDEHAGGEAEGEKDAGAEGEQPFFTVDEDGKEVKVTLTEAKAGYLRQADYTRKTQEVAQQREAAKAEVEQYRTNREQYANILKVLQERIGTEASEPTAEQWNELRESDPDRYAIEWADAGRRREQRDKVKAEQTRIENEKREEQKTALVAFVNDHRTKLLEKLPEWKDPVKAQAGMVRVREYAKTMGFTDAELEQAYDHRMIVAVDKARRYDALMAEKKKAMKKIDEAPEMPAPGNRTPPTNPKGAKRELARKELRTTGKMDLSLLDR